MRIIGLLSWFDESPTWLAATVSSMARVCDHVVALDGRYKHYEDDRLQSGIAQVDAVVEAARASGMGLTLHTAPRVWDTEMQKRTHLFRLGALEAVTFEDWFFILDGDEVLLHCSDRVVDTLETLARDRVNVGATRIIEETDPYADEARARISRGGDIPYVYSSPTPRFWRVLDDMRVDQCHYYYTGIDERGKRVALWGQQKTLPDTGETIVLGDHHDPDEPNLTPWHHFMEDDVMLENRCLQRARARHNKRTAYYQTRNELGIELQTVKRGTQEAITQ